VQTGLRRDPLGGELFLFVNRSRKLCKVLLWDGTGLCIFQKRLERGAFAKLWRDDGHVVRLTASELALFVEGCTLVGKQTLSPIAVERKTLVSDRAM
jgi:transposase